MPIYVTEWGLATDDGRCLSDNYGWDRCMTYREAAGTLRDTLGEMRARYGDRLRAVILYQLRDQRRSGDDRDREGYFGALRAEGEPKGAWTRAVREQLSSGIRLG